MSELNLIYISECEYRQGSAGITKCKLIGGLEVDLETCLHCPHIERKMKRAKEVER